MNKFKSEILFNRALLWLILSFVRSMQETNRLMAIVYLIPSVYNIFKSYEARAESE